MAKDEPITQTFAVPTPQVWEALRATIASLSYKDVQENAQAQTIEFRTGMSMWSWQGQNMLMVHAGSGGPRKPRKRR